MKLITPQCEKIIRDWLIYPGSFVERLKKHGVHYPRIRVLYQGWQYPSPLERKRLNIPARTCAFIREVSIGNENKTFMFARTVFPKTVLRGKWRCFQHLKNKTLGSILFKNHFKRSQFEILKTKETWMRRSIFSREENQLLLTEYFLKDVFKLCAQK